MADTDLDKLVKTIREESGLGEEEIREKVRAKIEELGGLIGEAGAAHLVAKELKVELPLTNSSSESALKIESIFAGMKNVDVVGKVLQTFPPKDFTKKDGSQGRVGNAFIGDHTGKIRVTFWDGDVQKLEELKEGDILKLRGAYSKEGLKDNPELHIGIRTRVIVNPRDVNPEDFPEAKGREVKVEELSGGMQGVDLVCKVLRIFEPNEFQRSDGSTGRVANILVSDETGVTRLSLWDERAEMVEDIKEGDILKVENGYVKEWKGKTDVNMGKYGELKINPEGITLEDAVEGYQGKPERKALNEAQEGELIEARGAIVDVNQPKIFEKDSKKGVVVNAVIDDGTESMRTAFYNDFAQDLLGFPLEELKEEDYQEEKLEERKKELLAREVVLTAKVKMNDFTENLELVARGMNLNPDPREEAGMLLEK